MKIELTAAIATKLVDGSIMEMLFFKGGKLVDYSAGTKCIEAHDMTLHCNTFKVAEITFRRMCP